MLDAPLVDAVHRITTDASRLSESWLRSLQADGLTPEAYVEAVGVAVITISIDRFHHAMGLLPEPLPMPQPGEPTRERPDEIVTGEAWVPMQPSKRFAGELGLPPGAPAPYVLRALSLVPREVRAWREGQPARSISAKQAMMSFDSPRSIDRSQIELVAGRVSALNECFY